ncbi:MAG: ferredoxin:thioredoxin reductase [Desulfobulbaceae bacterium]|uniref:ferredoxin:thioredoxin reductase n=1 Tax=Candidatus Desulfobia pelagia TaxID=2841692 RepID=A0A8J6NDS1_9BACT|nr:ferredoxin:thioredoxin reductase [Candidatus Desulfobia pelagia]
MTNVPELKELLRKIQEPQGCFFNRTQEQVEALLLGLLTNKDRYGYMSCPCRLASENRDKDRDIICPCVYREPDIKQYGSCYCGLYVSKDWNDGVVPHQHVPERRPSADKR